MRASNRGKTTNEEATRPAATARLRDALCVALGSALLLPMNGKVIITSAAVKSAPAK